MRLRKTNVVGPVSNISGKEASDTGHRWRRFKSTKVPVLKTAASPMSSEKETGEYDDCTWIINSLTEVEKETAARSSYTYFTSTSVSSSHQSTANESRDRYAISMARRHLKAEKGDRVKALGKMKDTIAFRQEINIDALRQCFHKTQFDNAKDEEIHQKLRTGIEKELSDGKHYIRGHDTDMNALFCIFPHRYQSFDPEWYLLGKIYNLERAIAYTERQSNGKAEKVNVIFDYSHYSNSSQPPLDLIKQLMFCLRDHYPERLRFLFFIDTPMRFRAFWAMLKPFIDPVTKKKVRFVTGDAQKREAFQGLITADEAMKFLLPTGKKDDEYFDMDKYHSHITFDYDMDETELVFK